MDLRRNPGRTIYGLLIFIAFLCALLEALTLLWGFAYAGAVGDAPGDPGFLKYSIVAATGFIGTAVLFFGMLGSSSPYRVFPILTIVATSLVLLPLCPYVVFGVRGNPRIWFFLVIGLDVAVITLSAMKLKQLRLPR